MPTRCDETKTRINRSIAWVGVASTAVGVLDWAAQIIILRNWISVADYGVAALAMALFPVLDALSDMGIASAIIQKDDHSIEKTSTVFWLNLMMALVMAGGALGLTRVFGALPKTHPVVCWMIVAYTGKLVFQNAYFIPHNLMKRDLRFEEISKLRIVANVAEFAGKIGFAAAGFGIWCFVLGPFARVLVTGVGTQILNPWRPKLVFRPRLAGEYFRFGLKTSASQVLFNVYSNADYYVVTAFFGPTATGLYKLAYELVLEPVRVIANVINDVAFPAISRLKAHREALTDQFVAFSRQSLIVVAPFVAVVLAASRELLMTVYGPAAADAATAAQVLCVVGTLRGVGFMMPAVLDGTGRPGTTLAYMAVATFFLPICFVGSAALLGDRIGFLSVAIGWSIGYPVAFVVLCWFVLRTVGLSAAGYFRRVIGVPACALGATATAIVARQIARGLPDAAMLALVVAVVVATFAMLLRRIEHVTWRSQAQPRGATSGVFPPQ
jgi:O-antigen/teichoic acid export membrane protein